MPRERREAVAVDADDLGRDALADLGLVARLGEDHQAAVAVQVDEARGDDPAGGVDAAADVRGQRLVGLEEPQPLPVDDDTPRSPGRAGPVDDRAAGDEQIRAVRHGRTVSAEPGERVPDERLEPGPRERRR